MSQRIVLPLYVRLSPLLALLKSSSSVTDECAGYAEVSQSVCGHEMDGETPRSLDRALRKDASQLRKRRQAFLESNAFLFAPSGMTI